MTPLDTFERSLPDVLVELGRRDASDLVAHVLDRTAGMPQRPRWGTQSWWASRLGIGHGMGLSGIRVARPVLVLVVLLALAVTVLIVGALLTNRPVFAPPGGILLWSGAWDGKGNAYVVGADGHRI